MPCPTLTRIDRACPSEEQDGGRVVWADSPGGVRFRLAGDPEAGREIWSV